MDDLEPIVLTDIRVRDWPIDRAAMAGCEAYQYASTHPVPHFWRHVAAAVLDAAAMPPASPDVASTALELDSFGSGSVVQTDDLIAWQPIEWNGRANLWTNARDGHEADPISSGQLLAKNGYLPLVILFQPTVHRG